MNYTRIYLSLCFLLAFPVSFIQANENLNASLSQEQAAESELENARKFFTQFNIARNTYPDDSEQVQDAFNKLTSAYEAIWEKYPNTYAGSNVLGSLFDLYQRMGQEKKANEILEKITQKGGQESVLNAYFTLALSYLQTDHDPGKALEWFKKIPVVEVLYNPNYDEAKDKFKYEQDRNRYYSVYSQIIKCEVQLGDFENLDKHYKKMIELYPNEERTLENFVIIEVTNMVEQKIDNKYWMSLSGIRQKLLQRNAQRWLEDHEAKKKKIEQMRWGKESNGLQCSISIESPEIKVGQSLVINVEIKNISSSDICLYYEDIYKATKLVLKNYNGEVIPSQITALYDIPSPEVFYKTIKPGQSFNDEIIGRTTFKFVASNDTQKTKERPVMIDFRDVVHEIQQTGTFSIYLHLEENEQRIEQGTNFGFSNIWTGVLNSNEIEFSIENMQRSELDDMIAQLSSSDKEEVLEAIEVVKANRDSKAVKELMKILLSGKGPILQASDALVRIQNKSVLPDLLEYYKLSTKYNSDERGEPLRCVLQTIYGLESDRQKMDELFIEIVKYDNPIATRKYAATQLGVRNTPEAIEALFYAANKEPEEVQWAAIDALGNIGSRLKIEEKNQVIEPMVEIMRTALDRTIRERAITALGQTGSDLVIPYLLEALKDDNLFIGAMASSYLGRLGKMEHIEPIEKYLSRAQTDGQKIAAQNAIKLIQQRNSSN